MTPVRAPSRRRSRFRYEKITERIEEARVRREMSTRALSEKIGMAGSAWYRKINGEGSRFTLDEFSAIAEALDAPEGWPFVEWK